MVLVVNQTEVDTAKMYAKQLEDELNELAESFHLGSIRKEGIDKKVNGLYTALNNIGIEQKEKPLPPPVPKVTITPVATPKYTPAEPTRYKPKK